MEERIWHKAYDPQVPPTIAYENITLNEALERSARNYPDQVALVMMGKKISYRELNALVNRFAAALRDLGVKKGDKVAILLPNIPQGFIACYAVFRLGAVVVMTNPFIPSGNWSTSSRTRTPPRPSLWISWFPGSLN
jgi:long-chain acyl-CoA synthetase